MAYSLTRSYDVVGTSNIPKVDVILEEAISKIRKDNPGLLEPASLMSAFSDAVEAVFAAAYDAYKDHEKTEIDRFVEERMSGWAETTPLEEIKRNAKEMAYGIIGLEKSLKQSRSSRAGKTFERIVQELLSLAGIPSESVTRGDERYNLSRIDLVIPDKRTAAETPDKAHFVSLKTSLRERWKQVVEEQSSGQRTHLVTLLQGETLANNVAEQIVDHGIFLYVPDKIKADRFPDEPRIRRLSDLPSSVG